MRPWLVMTRGAPGAGKSTFLRRHGLAPLAVTPDLVRDALGGLYEDAHGHLQRGPVREADAWDRVERDLGARMAARRPVIIDATFQRTRDFRMPTRLAAAHGYRAAVLDFTMVPVEVALGRNALRTGRAHVPEAVILRAYARFRRHLVPDDLLVVGFEAFADHDLSADIRASAG